MKNYVVSNALPGAFATVQDALCAAKQASLAEKEAVCIEIHGMQQLRETLRITAENLPGADHPVTIKGADENAGFTGGMPVTGFSRWKDNIWRVNVPEIEYTRHLYIDGKSAKRPATPFRKPYRWDVLEADDFVFSNLPGEEEKLMRVSDGPNHEDFIPDWSGIATTHTEIAEWKNLRDLEMVFEVGWVHRVVPVDWVTPLPDGRLYIKPLEPAFRSARGMEGVRIGGCPNCIENVFALLGEPLEWYFDRSEKMLYVGFAEGDSPENHEIVMPLVEQLLLVEGKLDRKPCHLRFENLQFMHTTWLFPQKYGVPEVQANQMKFTSIPEGMELEKPYEADYQKVIGALRVLAARDVSFIGCSFTMLGTGALQYEFGTQDSRISRNHFYEIGGSAVSLGDFYLDRAHHPDDHREIVRNIEITNNLIHDTGRDFRGSVAITAGYVQDVTIAHNDIFDVPYSAISLGWGWGETDVSVGPRLRTPWKVPTVCKRNRIMNNHIHHCMMMLCDGGAIYTLGRMEGTVISGNYIHESSGYQGEGYWGVKIGGYNCEEVSDPEAERFWDRHGVPGGIYLDEGSSGIEIRENILHDVAVPLNYHNQIDLGYTMVKWEENVLNKRPGDEGFPAEIAACAGREP